MSRAASGAGGGHPGIRGPARTKNAQSASGDFSDFRAVRQPACLLTCGFLWNRGPWVWGVGPHSNSPLRFIFGALFIDQKRSFFWKWVFLEPSGPKQPQTQPTTAPGHRTYRPRKKQAQVCSKTPGGWGLVRRSVLDTKRARSTFEVIVNKNNGTARGGGDVFTTIYLNLLLCTHWLQCEAIFYCYRV
jgi:hypothetical protein